MNEKPKSASERVLEEFAQTIESPPFMQPTVREFLNFFAETFKGREDELLSTNAVGFCGVLFTAHSIKEDGYHVDSEKPALQIMFQDRPVDEHEYVRCWEDHCEDSSVFFEDIQEVFRGLVEDS